MIGNDPFEWKKKSWNVNFGALLERIDVMTMLYWVETKAKKRGKIVKTFDFACKIYTQVVRVQSSTMIKKYLWPASVDMWKGP